MKALGSKIMKHNYFSIDNVSWGKRKLRGSSKAFYAMDYDLFVGVENKKASRQEAKKEIQRQLDDQS